MPEIFRRYLATGLLAGALCLGTSQANATRNPQQLVQQETAAEGAHEAREQSPITVEASPQIFAAMCALDAAGFDVDESALGEMPLRLKLHASLLAMNDPATDAVREFYRQHALSDSTEMLSQYITLALVMGPPPQFKFLGDQQSLPPDALSIQGFQPLLVGFYQAEHLDVRWAEVEPEYERVIARYRATLLHIVTNSGAYLREIVKPNGTTFTVYVEPSVGSRINFRNYGAAYAVVVGLKSDLSSEAIQYAYLHYMLDPMVLRDQKAILKKEGLLQIAARAPELPEEYQSDFVSLVDECVVRAVDLRVRNLPPAKLESDLAKEDASGFILVRPLVAELKVFEKAEPAMSYYMPDLIAGIDVAEQQARLKDFKFANGPVPMADELSFSQSTRASELDRLLAQGDRAIADKNAAEATGVFEQVVAKYPNDPRGLYGLAIASVLSGKAGQAKDLFEKIVALLSDPESSDQNVSAHSDPEVLSWAHVYLGRIHDLEDDRESAITEYRAALAVDGAPEAARIAAENGVEAPYAPPGAGGEKD
ncbi:MAG: tetratricopeptide repeat protein [Candidatus Acidiferrales bacterium]